MFVTERYYNFYQYYVPDSITKKFMVFIYCIWQWIILYIYHAFVFWKCDVFCYIAVNVLAIALYISVYIHNIHNIQAYIYLLYCSPVRIICKNLDTWKNREALATMCSVLR